MIRAFILTVPVLFLALPQSALAQEETFFSVMQNVVSNNPRLKQERAALDGAEAGVIEARAQYRPSVSVRASVSSTQREGQFTGGQLFDDDITPRTVSVEATQLLYNGGRRDIEMQSSILTSRAAKDRYTETELQVLSNAIEIYISLEVALVSLDLRKKIVETLERQLEFSRQRKTLGEAAAPEVLQIEARLAEVESDLASVRADIESLRLRLSDVSGSRVINVAAMPIFPVGEATLDDLLVTAQEFSPALRAARRDRTVSALALKGAVRQRWPTVNLFGRASSSEDASSTVIEEDDFSVGLDFTVPIYAGGALVAGEVEAASARRQARFAYQAVQGEVNQRMIQLWTGRKSNEAVLAARQKRASTSEQALEALEKGLDAGFNSVVDVLDAVEALLDANLRLAETEAQLKATNAYIALYTGRIRL